MAQFLKVNAGPAADDGIETLIPISKIAGIESVTNATSVTTIVIKTDSTATSLYTIAVPGVTGAASQLTTSAMREKDATDALNAALTANPGGVVSTLSSVPAFYQTPAAQSGQDGKILITQAATWAQYTTCIYTP